MPLTLHKAETPNFRKGRRGEFGIDQIVIHVTEGEAEGTLSWFGSAKSGVSAHYHVRKTGWIDQFVDEDDEAFHAGRVNNPTAPLVLERLDVNPNYYSIGIEHEGSGNEDLTPEQRKSSIMLLRDISTRRSIPLNRRHVVGHHEIFFPKTCPGAIKVDTLVSQAAANVHPGSPDKEIPRVVWSGFFGDYLIVTKFVSDSEWYFVKAGDLEGARVMKAQTPLSNMPTAK